MNISFPNSASPSPQVENQQTTQTTNRSTQNAGVQLGTQNAEVSLSNTGVQALKAQLTNLPSIRQERVQTLQKAVENGTYKPSSQQIANAIHADLFGAASSTQA